jgi:hypothetical protein
MKIIYKTFNVLFILLVASCQWADNDSFYQNYSEEDLYRLPLIKPYQLIQLYGIDKSSDKSSLRKDEIFNVWSLRFVYGGDSQSPGFTYDVNATEINIKKGVIYGHRPKREDYPDVWFVIIPNEKIEKVFKDKKNEWKNYLKSRNIDPPVLHPIWPLFNEFRANGTLLWYDKKKKKIIDDR